MINYLKYLKNNPLKLCWIIAINTILIALAIIGSSQVFDAGIWLNYLFGLFLIIIGTMANYQPYKEYKDGL